MNFNAARARNIRILVCVTREYHPAETNFRRSNLRTGGWIEQESIQNTPHDKVSGRLVWVPLVGPRPCLLYSGGLPLSQLTSAYNAHLFLRVEPPTRPSVWLSHWESECKGSGAAPP